MENFTVKLTKEQHLYLKEKAKSLLITKGSLIRLMLEKFMMEGGKIEF